MCELHSLDFANVMFMLRFFLRIVDILVCTCAIVYITSPRFATTVYRLTFFESFIEIVDSQAEGGIPSSAVLSGDRQVVGMGME